MAFIALSGHFAYRGLFLGHDTGHPLHWTDPYGHPRLARTFDCRGLRGPGLPRGVHIPSCIGDAAYYHGRDNHRVEGEFRDVSAEVPQIVP